MALLGFPGPLVNWRGFKQVSIRRLRTTTVSESEMGCLELAEHGYGNVVKLRVPRSPKETVFFIKCKPDAIPPDEDLISVDEYAVRYSIACHSSITPSIKKQLVAKSFVDKDFLSELVTDVKKHHQFCCVVFVLNE